MSGTYLCHPTVGERFVRKEVSLRHNREYGFQRWCSQLKRLQRYEHLFPGIFPKLLSYGKDGDLAYFDMEYIDDSITVSDFLSTTSDEPAIDALFRSLVQTMQRMHSIALSSSTAPIELYIHEEIEQRIAACAESVRFGDLLRFVNIDFNGEVVPGLVHVLDEYKDMAVDSYRCTSETFTHGNLTLENILYQPTTGRLVFIDPYEENIVDSVLAEYSQILQSANSLYELYNSASPEIEDNRVSLRLDVPDGLRYFNALFGRFLQSRHDDADLVMIRLFEVSQYVRMLPFKMEIDEDKMLFFYALSSYLFHMIRQGASRP